MDDSRDALTGLPNRRKLEQALHEAVARAKAEDRPLSVLSVLFVDCDHLKSLNDALGHEVGDDVLRQVARAARDAVGLDAMLSRQGGDEFVAVLEVHLDDAVTIAKRLRAAVEQATPITVTVGVAARPACVDGWDARLMLEMADARVDYAKSFNRRNLVVAELLPSGRQHRLLAEVAWPWMHGGTDSIRPRADWVLDWTGLPGRRELSMAGSLLVEAAHRTGDSLTALFIDLDGLARYNDTAGIAAGDRMLIRAARLLDDVLRPVHLVCRYGNTGDEFAALVKLDIEGAAALAEGIRLQAVRELEPLSVSIGMAARPSGTGWSCETLVEVAAARLQDARQGGRRNFVAAQRLPDHL